MQTTTPTRTPKPKAATTTPADLAWFWSFGQVKNVIWTSPLDVFQSKKKSLNAGSTEGIMSQKGHQKGTCVGHLAWMDISSNFKQRLVKVVAFVLGDPGVTVTSFWNVEMPHISGEYPWNTTSIILLTLHEKEPSDKEAHLQVPLFQVFPLVASKVFLVTKWGDQRGLPPTCTSHGPSIPGVWIPDNGTCTWCAK